MKVIVDQNACIGCGLCAETCPEVFRMNDDNLAEAYVQPTEMVPGLQEAADGCPVAAITIEQ